MTATKTMTLRLRPELSELLSHVAQIEGLSQAAVIRRALAHHLRTRTTEAEFLALCQAARDEQDELVRALLRDTGIDPDQPLSKLETQLIPPERVADYLASLDY
jgi:predicted transcriptional regulator